MKKKERKRNVAIEITNERRDQKPNKQTNKYFFFLPKKETSRSWMTVKRSLL